LSFGLVHTKSDAAEHTMDYSTEKILIVEDSMSTYLSLKAALESQLHLQVSVAETHEAASKLIKNSKEFALAILDLALPDAPHGEIVDLVSAHKIPSLVLTAILDGKTRKTMMEKNVVDYFIKKENAQSEIIVAVERLLANKNWRILIVDDSSSARSLIKSILSSYLFQVVTAANGQEALGILQQDVGIRLVITDNEMPGMNGVELTGNIRTLFGKDELGIIGVASGENETLVSQFLKHGANDFVHKPFGREELYSRVLNAIRAIEYAENRNAWARKLQDSEERERDLIEQAPIGIFRTTHQGRILFANSWLAKLYGYDSADDLMNSIQDIGKQLYVDSAERDRVKVALERGPIDGMDVRRRRKDGSVIWVSLSMRAVLGPDNAVSHYEGFVRDITAQHNAEEALRESEGVRKKIMNCIDAGIMVINPRNHTIEFANETAALMFGASKEEIIGHVCHKFLCPAAVGKCPITDLDQEVERSERTLLRIDGQEIPILKSAKRIMAKGEEKLLETFVDISDRKAAEENLQQERVRLTNILEGTRAGTWEWNVQTGEIFVNERWAAMLGYTLGELSPITIKTLDQYTHPEDLKESKATLDRHFSGELEYYDSKYRMRHKNGQWIWVHDRGRLISHTQDGKPLMMYGTHTDINASKTAHQALRESEERYRIFFESADAIRLVIDPDTWMIEDANKAAVAFYGHSVVFMKGMQIFDISTATRGTVIKNFLSMANKDNSRFCGKHKLENGEIRDVEVYTSPIYHMGKHLLMASIHDITEIRRLEEVKAEVEHIMRHDLKAPLNGFINIPEMLLDEENFTEEQRQLLRLLGASGKRMLGQINNSLALHKIEEGHYETKLQNCSPAQLVQENAEMLLVSRGLPPSMIAVSDNTINESGVSQVVQTDTLLLNIVLMNLLGNALDASDPGKPVAVDLSIENERYRISITNSRPVPKQIRNTFFQKFVTHGKPGGTGLGTYSAWMLTEALGGKIFMESSEQTGTKVTVGLPC